MANYNLLLCSDNNYLPYTFVACQSVINSLEPEYSKEKDTVVFNLFVDETVNESDFSKKCDSFSARNNSAYVNVEFNIYKIDSDNFDGASKFRDHTFSAYYRILLGKILPIDLDKVLYIDVDTLVRKDIRRLFNETDLSNSVLGAVADYGIEYLYENKLNIVSKIGGGY